MKIIAKVLLVLSFFLSVQGYAQSEEQQLAEFRQAAKDLVHQAISNGHESIDGVSLQTVLEDIEKPKLAFFKNGYATQGTRDGAMYEREAGFALIRLRKDILAQTPPDLVAPWSLHEHLGANAYEDRDYNMSLQIIYAAKKRISSPLINKILKERTNSELQKNFQSSGSGTSVAGGGDPQSIRAKLLAIDTLNSLNIQGERTYDEAQLTKMLQIAIDCSFELVDGTTAVGLQVITKRAVYNPRLGLNYPPGTGWAKVTIDRNWFQQTSTKEVAGLLLEGLSKLAEVPLTLCDHHSNIQAPPGSPRKI